MVRAPAFGARQTLACASLLTVAYAAARVGIQLLEAWTIVHQERADDAMLIELCREGRARDSPRMRHACLEAHAANASPVLFKVVVHAANVMLADLATMFSSWTSVALVAVFLFTGAPMTLLLPMARAYARRIACRGHSGAPSEYRVLCVDDDEADEHDDDRIGWTSVNLDDDRAGALGSRTPLRWLSNRIRRRSTARQKLLGVHDEHGSL
jgi:hypothetical protein